MPDRPPNPDKAARLAREAEALRANLTKRKIQARERARSAGIVTPRPTRPEPASDKA